MASSLSNLTSYIPFSTEKSIRSSCCSKFPVLGIRGRRTYPDGIKATAEGKSNLDHLQRVGQPQQPRPKARVIQVAPSGLWERFPGARTVQQMMDTMDRMMEDPLVYSTLPSSAAKENSGYGRGRTPWGIKERENDYMLRFDMPGMTRDDVKVWVEDSMLVFKAEKKGTGGQGGGEEEGKKEEEEWPAQTFGRYSSRIALPENIELDKIKAEVRDGVLYITIPKARSTSKVIDIDVQ